MTLLDKLVLLVALLIIWFAPVPVIPTLAVAVLVMILIAISRGERIP